MDRAGGRIEIKAARLKAGGGAQPALSEADHFLFADSPVA